MRLVSPDQRSASLGVRSRLDPLMGWESGKSGQVHVPWPQADDCETLKQLARRLLPYVSLYADWGAPVSWAGAERARPSCGFQPTTEDGAS